MHIPDGYLSPATCAALYTGVAPFWWVALRRLKKRMGTRLIPLISLFAAFSFVVMMFNLPLPGGTTGHAVGVAITAIVIGPWASILSLSTALLIQALFFGDGGITALGANCFNMAVVGSLTSYLVYRLIAGQSPIDSRRRVVAAALAGYIAINVAALLAAIEFGIQPIWFHDAAGAPLYAPYPLHVAVPAMMLGHLTIAGLAELTLTAGIVAYLQRTNPVLLVGTASGLHSSGACARHCPGAGKSPFLASPASYRTGLKKLWLGLAGLLLLTPLGVLAVGTAWGEWAAQDFASAAARQKIAAASLNQEPPPQVPRGMQRLSSVWTAPFPAYAPSVVRNRALGYMLSGMFGAGAILFLLLAGRRLVWRGTQPPGQSQGATHPSV
jgi:cobalt/nickel transport system permease protein